MKIGIITIHAAYNYGSALQAIACCEAIQNFTGNSTEIIDFQPDSIMSVYSLNIRKNLGSIKEFIKYIVAYNSRKNKKRAFDMFWKIENCLSKQTYHDSLELAKTNDLYDMFVVGSDQVWNPEIVGNAFEDFCLKFVADNKIKNTYASSFGVNAIKRDKLELLNNALKKFEHIAVREKDAKQLLNIENMRNPVQTVCDPVFLLTKEQWGKKAKAFTLPKHYILVYCVEIDKKLQNEIKELSSRFQLPVIDAGFATNPKNYVGIHNNNMGPSEFLYAIKNADYIITNSFHGTAFSIIFRKKFVVKAHSKRGVRMENLLDICSLKDRLIYDNDSIEEIMLKINKENPQENTGLDKYIENSKKYIKLAMMK